MKADVHTRRAPEPQAHSHLVLVVALGGCSREQGPTVLRETIMELSIFQALKASSLYSLPPVN